MSSIEIKGRGRLGLVYPICGQQTKIAGVDLPGVWLMRTPWQDNLRLYESASIMAALVRRDPAGRPYHISAMYLEFENNGGAAVSVPTASRDDGQSYYDNLSDHPTRDYLQVPIISTELTSSDEALFLLGNQISFFAQTAGSEGVHGKEFSGSQQSRVYGAALVATPVPDDPSQNLVFSRLYYSSADQTVKTASNHQIGQHYLLTFN